MKKCTAIALLIPFIFSACSANLSDKELVDEFYKNELSNIETDIDKTVTEYSSSIVTKYLPEPYFNPTQPIPHYYAEKLDALGVPYPKELVYESEEYNFYKSRAQVDVEHHTNTGIKPEYNH